MVRTDKLWPPERTGHHRVLDAGGRVVIPDRRGWWAQLQREKICRKIHGHCYHQHLFTFWNCCMCGGSGQGLPKFRCQYCTRESK
jgi:hypothetical protein